MMRHSSDTVPKRASQHGWVELVLGPMFAGKTTEVARKLERFEIARRKCIIVKYAGDTRYSTDDVIITHRGVQSKIKVHSAKMLRDVRDIALEHDVIGIDEGQFYPDIVEFARSMANNGKIVIIAYLDATWEGKPFGPIGDLVAMAESVQKLSAICDCGEEAHFSKRIVQNSDLELIGGKESYSAACRKCFGSFAPDRSSQVFEPAPPI